MSALACTVQAVIGHLEASGHEVLETAFEANFTPHVVAQSEGHLLFALVVITARSIN